MKARIFGIDLSKRRPEPPDEPEKVPEATGVITGCVFLMVTILLIPMTFSRYLVSGNSSVDKSGTKQIGYFLSTAVLKYTPIMVYNVHLKFQTSVSLRIFLYGSRNLTYIACKMDYMGSL